MEFKNTLEIVTKDIQDIEKLVSNFKNYSSIPNIELDLALSRLRNVYDLLLMFRDDSNTEAHKHSHTTVKEETAPGKKVTIEPSPVNHSEHVKKAVTVVETKTIPAPVSESAPTQEKSVVGKKPTEEKTYINEKLGEKTHKKDISSKLQGQAIKSVAGSLGINDKFFFIRELFKGNSESFRQTMDELDEAHNFNDAYSLLINKFEWDMDSEPVQMLLNLIRRKFITSGNE
jgi:hypothetical protein